MMCYFKFYTIKTENHKEYSLIHIRGTQTESNTIMGKEGQSGNLFFRKAFGLLALADI